MKSKHFFFLLLCFLCATNVFSQSILLTSTTPTIDGEIDAVWANAAAFTIDKVANGTPTNNPAGTWRVMTNNVNFYFLVEITDENKFGNTQANNYWNGDAVEIYIASNNGNTANQIGFGYVSNTGTMRRYGKTDTGGSFYMKDTSTGYLLEASLPLSYFGISSLTTTSTVKLELGVNQGQTSSRQAQLNTFNNSTEHRNSTANYGDVSVTSTPTPQTDVVIQALGRTNINSDGSNFAALTVKSISTNVGDLRSKNTYLWEVNTGSGYAQYTGKNYNNNNIRPTKAGTYRCTVYNINDVPFVSNEITVTASAATTNLTTNLPIIVVYTGSNQFPSPQGGCGQVSGSGYPSKDKIDVDVKILWNEQGGDNSLANMANNAEVYYDRKAVMNYRGSTSRSMIKRSYAFSTGKKDIIVSSGKAEKGKVDLFGLPEEKDWILYAAYNDKSMMRNKLAIDLYRQFGYYASATKYVELYINDVYQGVYVFLEKYEENENRINITTEKKLTSAGDTDIQPEEIGYIIKFDKTDGSAATWVRTASLLGGMSNCGNEAGCGIAADAQGWELVYPEVESDSDPRKNYIRTWLAQFEIALKNASSQQDWDNLFEIYIDIPSFVDFMIIDELARNTDGYRASMWFVKDAGGKLKCTPIWDFEMGFGNDDKYPSFDGSANRTCPSTTNAKPYATDIWQYNTNECEPYYPLPFWYEKLMENQCFKDIFRTRWEELRQTALSQEHITAELENNNYELTANGAQTREQDKWSWLVRNACPCENQYAYCPWMITRWEANYQGVGNPSGKTTTWEYEYKILKAWINARLVWMDSQISTDNFGTVLTETQIKECAKISEEIPTKTPTTQEGSGISIAAENRFVKIAAQENIQTVSIYDTKGILLVKKNNVNSQNFSLKLPSTSNALIVKVLTKEHALNEVVLVQ